MLVLSNYDNFFNNLFPLRHLFPFVQSVLPTVFDDSLSYLETLGKVVKALNDTESNVNTLEQAVRAFADDLALYGNLTISPVEITFNQETGRYTASMEYADIVSAIEEGHTMVMHVVDDLHDAEYYTATMKLTETGNGVKVLYWESPAFTVNDVTVFYEAFINENDIAGVTTRTITGSGSDVFIIHYDTDTETADKTFAEIAAAIEAEKNVILIADQFFISTARWTTSGNDQIGYEIISVQFNAFNVVTAPSGKNLGCVTYAVNDADTWTVTRNGFPNESRVNALIDAKLAQRVDTFIINYDSEMLTADKTFSEIVAAIEAEKPVVLFADNFIINDVRWTTTGNDQDGYEVIAVQFNAFNVVSATTGKNLGCVTYAVDDNDTWTIDRNGFPNETRVNALIDVKLAQLEGFNSIIKLDYNESTGAVTYWDGEQTVNASGQYISNNLIDLASPQLLILEGVQQHDVGMQTINTYISVEWGQTTGAWFIDFYRVYDGNVELVRVPYASNIATKTQTPIGGGSVSDAVLYTQQTLTDLQKAQARDNIGADSKPLILNVTESNGTYTVDKTAAEIRANLHNLLLTFGLNEGVTIDSYQIYGSPPMHNIVFTVCDPAASSATYIRYLIQVYFAGQAPTQADDVPVVTRSVIQHNIGGGSLPVTTNASAGDFLRLDANKNAVWETVPAAENNSFGGA